MYQDFGLASGAVVSAYTSGKYVYFYHPNGVRQPLLRPGEVRLSFASMAEAKAALGLLEHASSLREWLDVIGHKGALESENG